MCVASAQWGSSSVVTVDCYTLRGRQVCVLGVKCGDLCGSQGVVVQGADWHHYAGSRWRNADAECSNFVYLRGVFWLGWLR